MIRNRLFRFGRVCVQCLPSPGFATAFLVLSLINLLLPCLGKSSFLWNDGLGFHLKAALAGLIVLSWAAIMWTIFWYFQIVRKVTQRMKSRLGCLSIRITACVLFAVAINFYFASGLFFWRLGIFPGLDSIIFGTLNFEMLTRYFWQTERTDLIICLFAFTGVTVISATIAWRLSGQFMVGSVQRNQPWICGVVILLMALNATWFAVKPVYATIRSATHDSDRVEAFKNSWPPYTFEVRFRVSPTMSVLADLVTYSDDEFEGEIPDKALVPLRIQQAGPQPTTPAHHPSVIIITVESLRSDVIFMQHQEKEIMPSVNELARTGHFFPNCYAQSVQSDYSDPCILSSLYPLRKSRAYFYRRAEPWPKVLIYDLLKTYGYSTAIYSSQNETWSNMHLFYASPNLDIFFDSRKYQGPTYVPEGFFSRWLIQTGHAAGKLDDAITMRCAIKWMKSQQQLGKPYFVSINLQTSHFPYEIPNGKTGPFQPAEIDFDKSLGRYPREKVKVVRNAYFNALYYIDQQIGELVKYLDANHLRKDTIICITGDHGQAFYENGEATHGQAPLETTTKVGLIMNCPNDITPAIDNYLAQSIDIAPSVAALVGIPTHPAFQGIDLLSKQRCLADERLVFIHCNNPIAGYDAVISGTGWKYVFDNRTDYRFLYYRPTDMESHLNLADFEPKITARMHELLAEWRRRQLIYYARPRYYNWFYPPREPRLSSEELGVLRCASRKIQRSTPRSSFSLRVRNP